MNNVTRKKLAQIAREQIPELEGRLDLAPRRNDAEDFFETSVWSLEAALAAAYELGRTEDKADYLLDNGVIVPPCKVGDTVYEHQTAIWMDECAGCDHFRCGGFGDPHECARTKSPFKHPDCTEIEEVVATQKNVLLWIAYGEFGKTVFLTREEAERALKGGEE